MLPSIGMPEDEVLDSQGIEYYATHIKCSLQFNAIQLSCLIKLGRDSKSRYSEWEILPCSWELTVFPV